MTKKVLVVCVLMFLVFLLVGCGNAEYWEAWGTTPIERFQDLLSNLISLF